MDKQIARTKNMLANIVPAKKRNAKGDFLDSMKDEILGAKKRGVSLRQIFRTLEKGGYAGSYPLLQQSVNLCGWACGACPEASERKEFANQSGKFFWRCRKCGTFYADKDGKITQSKLAAKPKESGKEPPSVTQ